LNSLLHALESTLARAHAAAGDADASAAYQARAARRAEAVRRLLWDDNEGVFTDHLFEGMASTGQVTLATVYPLYFGIADEAQARSVARVLRERLLQRHGLATTTVRSGEQWDLPNGWAPLQWLAIRGLERYGEHDLAREVATRWIRRNLELFARQRKLVEKYDVTGEAEAGGGEYPLQDGFGWTNGATRALLARYPDTVHPRCSAWRDLAPRHPAGREDDLPQLDQPRTEAGHRPGQVVAPHPPEALVIARRQPRPRLLDVVAPGLQGAVVVGAEVVPVLDHEATFQRPGDLRGRGQHRVGEDVLGDPGVGVGAAGIGADGVQQEQPI